MSDLVNSEPVKFSLCAPTYILLAEVSVEDPVVKLTVALVSKEDLFSSKS